MLAVTALHDSFSIPQDKSLVINDQIGGEFLGLQEIQNFDAKGNVVQIEHSPSHDLLFLRNSGSAIRVLDANSGELIATQLANAAFTDFDLSPSGDYLYAADFGGERVGHGDAITPHYVHQFDLANRAWTSKKAPKIAWKIEAISDNEFVLQEQDQWISLTINSFGTVEDTEVIELWRRSGDYRGDIEFDFRTNLILHGNSGNSSNEIHSYSVNDGKIALKGETGTYGTADGHGGSVVLSSDGAHLYYGRLQVETGDVRNNLNEFPEIIRAATAKIAFGANTFYHADSTERAGELGFSTEALYISDDSRHLWAFAPNTDRMHHYRFEISGIGVLANDSASDQSELSAEVVIEPQNGSVTLMPNGTFVYQPRAGFAGDDSFVYEAKTDSGESSTASVIIEVVANNRENRKPTGASKTYFVDQDSSLYIDSEHGDFSTGIDPIDNFQSPGNVTQIEYSSQYDLLALRNSGSLIRILDGTTGAELSSLLATESFTDMDLTNDGRYLFVADYGGERTGRGTPIRPHFVHRFDMETLEWQSKQAPRIAWKIEAVSPERLMLQERDQHVDMTLNSFPNGDAEMKELSRIRADYYGDFEFDERTGRVYHGSSGSSSAEIHARRVDGDELKDAGNSGSYGSADGYGGTSVLASDGSRFYYGRLQVEALDITNNTNVMPEVIYAASPEIAIGELAVYEAASGRQLAKNEFDSTLQHVDETGKHFWSFDSENDQLHHYRLRDRQVGLLAHDDDDDDSLSVELVTGPEHGELKSFEANGTVEYVPMEGFDGTDSFTYRIFDGELYSDPIIVTLNVIPTSNASFVPRATPDVFEMVSGQTLTVDATPSGDTDVYQLQSFDIMRRPEQLEYSPQFGLVALRTLQSVRVFDAETQQEIANLSATNDFTDFDLTPDGRFLFVADYGGEIKGSGTPVRPHWVHRLDLASRQWISKEAPSIAWKIEAVAKDRILLQEHDQHVDMMLNDFGASDAAPIIELSRARGDYYGDFEYDHRTGRIYHGSTGSSSHEVHVRTLENDRLRNSGATGTYGTAQGFQGPSLLSADGAHFYYGRLQVEALDVQNNLNQFPSTVLAASGDLAFLADGIYDASNAQRIGAMTMDAGYVSDDGRHLWAMRGLELAHYQLGSRQGGVLENDVDLGGESLAVRVATPPQNGTLEMDGNGGLEYVPNPGFVGTDSFTYIASNADHDSEPTEVAIIVRPINQPPTISPIEDIVVNEDDPQIGPFIIHIQDPSSPASSIRAEIISSNRDLTGNTIIWNFGLEKHVTLLLKPDRYGQTEITISVTDGEFTTTTSFHVDVLPVNDRPVARTDRYGTLQGTPLSILDPSAGLLANDSDVDDPLGEVTIATGPAHGTLENLGEGRFTYVPNDGFAGVDTFRYSLTDPHGATDYGNVRITVSDNTPPRVSADDIPDQLFAGDLSAMVQFSEPIQLPIASEAVYVTNDLNSRFYAAETYYDEESHSLRFEMPRLPVGDYQLVVDANRIRDRSGNRLDGKSNGSVGVAFTKEFVVLGTGHDLVLTGPMDVLAPSSVLRVPLEYTSQGDITHTGVALRVHFDSSLVTYRQTIDLYQDALLVSDQILPDTQDNDGDPATDSYVVFAWNDISANWPGIAGPVTLGNLEFVAADVLQHSKSTFLRLSPVGGAEGFAFNAEDLEVHLRNNFDLFDIDLDGKLLEETDGQIINRYLLGTRGQALTSGGLGDNARRSEPSSIEAYLRFIRPRIDVDGNGLEDAFTDGLLFSRFIIASSDEELIKNAVAIGATRDTAIQIREYLDYWNPLFASSANDFNNDGVLDQLDLDALHTAIVNEDQDLKYDINRDSQVNVEDVAQFLDHTGRMFGDSNFDGTFDSSDLVLVFRAGLYETGQAATWLSGDWNADGKFNTSDLIIAFGRGRYSAAASSDIASAIDDSNNQDSTK